MVYIAPNCLSVCLARLHPLRIGRCTFDFTYGAEAAGVSTSLIDSAPFSALDWMLAPVIAIAINDLRVSASSFGDAVKTTRHWTPFVSNVILPKNSRTLDG